MKYVALIYMIGIAIYNLFGNNSLYWRFHYFFLSSFVLTIAFYELYKKAIGKSRTIYFAGFVFSFLYTMFELFALTSKSITEYLNKINSEIWSTVSFSIILILFYMLYDTNLQRKISKYFNSIRTCCSFLFDGFKNIF